MIDQQLGGSAWADLSGLELLKGHSTGKDLLLLIDPDCQVELGAAQVTALCDRRAGVGADGFVRVVRTSALPGAEGFAQAVPEAEWFMDHYLPDGSVAPVCGSALRLFAQVLDAQGLQPLADGEAVTVGTRWGARTVTRSGELWTVDMGPAHLLLPPQAAADPRAEGWDTLVELPGLAGYRAALSLSLPAPHTVVALAEESELEAVDLSGLHGTKDLDVVPRPEDGSSLSLVVPLGVEYTGGQEIGRARLRALMQGGGEDPSGGDGACAVAVALHEWEGAGAPQDYLLDVPGGSLGVHVGEDPWAPGATVLLTGPATITGRVVLA